MAGGTARNAFLNGVALFESVLSVRAVLARCQALEQAAGRRRARHWGDRPLDLDVLIVEGVLSDAPGLMVPHPAIRLRPFVLLPLLEVWPDAYDERKGQFYQNYPPAPGPQPWPVGIVRRVSTRVGPG
jgi:2-amino-4-hydroxy-6-hydroxymethyldihydropteridine diphosphokinase